MADEGRFAIDVAELDAVIAHMERTESELRSLTEDIETRMMGLQSVWEGLAAEAQVAAQTEWGNGMRAMREAIADLRLAARAAHGNYAGATEANLGMWRDLG